MCIIKGAVFAEMLGPIIAQKFKYIDKPYTFYAVSQPKM